MQVRNNSCSTYFNLSTKFFFSLILVRSFFRFITLYPQVIQVIRIHMVVRCFVNSDHIVQQPFQLICLQLIPFNTYYNTQLILVSSKFYGFHQGLKLLVLIKFHYTSKLNS